MRLNDITEPLFQYVCMLRRLGKNSVEYSYDKALNDVRRILNDIEHKASQDRILGMQYGMVKMPLIFFVDSMIAESGISFAAQWDDKRIAYEYSEMTGDHKFFEILDEIFADRLHTQEDCLRVFYTCIGLGFKGIYKNKPKKLQQVMWKICDHIPDVLSKEEDFVVENDLEWYKEKRKLPFFISFWRPRNFIVVISVLLLIWIFSNMFLYLGASRKAEKAFNNIPVEKVDITNQNTIKG